MLFLFNAHVIDVGDVMQRLASPDFPLSLQAASKLAPRQIEDLFRDTAYFFDDMVAQAPAKAAAAAALLNWRTGANALITVKPEGARSPADCHVRFAQVSIESMAWMAQESASGNLTPRMIDREVWARAA